MKLSEIKLNENNPRHIKKDTFEKLKLSIQKFPKMMKLRPIIIDKDNIIPPNTEIGYHPKEDSKRFKVSSRGIVVVPKGYFKRGE